MSKFEDLTGQRFGRLVVLERLPRRRGATMWKCQCDCGKVAEVRAISLKSGTRSCGCLTREATTARNRKHGAYGTYAHSCWRSMKNRCYTVSHKDYARYGGRGILVCDRWRESFDVFLEDMGNPPSEKHTIDRIDSNGSYEPGNCRWATSVEQANNRSNTRMLTHNGKTQGLAEWARDLGQNYDTLKRRVQLGWSDEEVLTKRRYGRKNDASV